MRSMEGKGTNVLRRKGQAAGERGRERLREGLFKAPPGKCALTPVTSLRDMMSLTEGSLFTAPSRCHPEAGLASQTGPV